MSLLHLQLFYTLERKSSYPPIITMTVLSNSNRITSFSLVIVYSLLLLLLLLVAFTAAYTTPQCTNAFPTITRRNWWMTSIASSAALLSTTPPANAADSVKLTVFDDPTRGFSLSVPSEWTFIKQVLRDRRELLLWRDPADGSTALSIAYTPVRDDFTSLASFGPVEQVAAQTIMPKGVLAGNEQDLFAKMLSAKSAKQAYIFDYQQTVPMVSMGTPTHFRAIFALQQGATGGAGSILVTITAQTPEARYASLQPSFDAIIDSFGKSKTV